MYGCEKNFIFNAGPDTLTISKTQKVFWGMSTVLKYCEHTTKETVVLVSNEKGEHAEEQMLYRIYETNYDGLQKSLVKAQAMLRSKTTELGNKTHLRKSGEKWKSELKALEDSIKDLEGKCEKLTKKRDISWQVVEYLKENKGKEMDTGWITSAYKSVALPTEFWVSKSPCSRCSEKLIAAYASSDVKPTVHISTVYEGKRSNLTELVKNCFTFEQWDMYQEYKIAKEDYEKTGPYKHYDATRKNTKDILLSLSKDNV
jgi:hypothetical protein